MNKIISNNKGFSLIELLVAVAIFGILAAGVFRVATYSYSNFYGTGDRQAITEFAKEGAEAVRAIRDASWQYIESQALDTATGVSKDGNGTWIFSGSSDTNGVLTRTIVLSSVYRDANGNIVDSGGTLDNLTRKVTITVSGSGIDDYVLIIYLSNWSIKSWVQTDWSGFGTASFWSSSTMASSFSAIATSTIGESVLSAYSFSSSKMIVIDSDKVSGSSNHSNFPLYFSAILDSLRTTANGGDVTNDNAYDIIFSSDSAGSTILDHEIQSYNSSTGAFEAWVEVPTLDYNDDTNIYMFYGNPGISTSQENATGVWDTNYVSVLHMEEDPTGNSCSGGQDICDSTSYNNHANASSSGGTVTMTSNDSVVAVTGNGIELDGGDDFLAILDSSSLDDTTGVGQARTASFWLNIVTGENGSIIIDKSGFTGEAYWLQLDDTTGTSGNIIGGFSYAGGSGMVATPSLGIGAWHYVVMTYDGSNERLYIDGALDDGPDAITVTGDTNEPFLIAGFDHAGYKTNAIFDELRISKTDRSADWIATEYENMNSPDTFYYIANNIGFAHHRPIVIDNSKVSGTQNISNFPLFVTTTADDLKTVSNGGLVTNDNGYDIVFSSDVAGNTILDHEIEYYSSSTGAVAMWVRVPTLYYNTDTTIYMQYGSTTISTSQENITGVWDSDYVMVHHMKENPAISTDGICGGSFLDACDSTSNANDALAQGTMATTDNRIVGPLGYAYDLNGTDDYMLVLDSTSLKSATGVGQARTYSMWININNAVDNKLILDKSLFNGYDFWLQTQGALGDVIGGVVPPPSSYLDSNPIVGVGSWQYVSVTYDGSDENLYVGGVLNDGPVTVTAAADNTNAIWIGGAGGGTSVDAYLDELRISKIARSVDWIKTETNNMGSPSTFYSVNTSTDNVGPSIVLGEYNTPGSITSSIYDLGATSQNLSTITIEQNVPSGCSLTVTLEADDNNNFSSAVSESYSSSTVSSFTENVTSTLDGYRWLRYKADFTACNSNTETPTLYSVKVDYK